MLLFQSSLTAGAPHPCDESKEVLLYAVSVTGLSVGLVLGVAAGAAQQSARGCVTVHPTFASVLTPPTGVTRRTKMVE